MNTEEELEKYKKKLLILQEDYKKLAERCKQKQQIISKHISCDILEYLSECNSLTETAKKFECLPEELYYCISEWDGYNDILYRLIDYNIYRNKLQGRGHELDNPRKINNLMMRTPEQIELDTIFTEYTSGELSLYAIADKYNLSIINLFRLLKEHDLIEKESDAIGYNNFYKEYIGLFCYNKYNIITNLNLIDIYYKYC
jgi:hypothetical protein